MRVATCVDPKAGDDEPRGHSRERREPEPGSVGSGVPVCTFEHLTLACLDAAAGTATVDEMWGRVTPDQVERLLERVTPEDLVGRPVLIALWARLHAHRGRPDQALTASRVACTLVSPDTNQQFTDAEEQFQRTLATGPDESAARMAEKQTEAHPGDLLTKRLAQESVPFSITMFGGLEVYYLGKPLNLARWRNNKARNLLVSIAIEQGREVSRDLILDRLWPSRDLSSALNNFYVTWNAMKRTLMDGIDSDAGPVQFPIVNCGQRCAVLLAECQLDLNDFDACIRSARASLAGQRIPEALRHLAILTRIYRGELLSGDTFYEWVVPYREHYRAQFLDAMILGSTVALDERAPDLAMTFALKGLAADRFNEQLTQCYIRACIASGRREDGIRAYHRCRTYLSEELGLDPSAGMRSLYQELIEDESVSRR